MNNRQIIGLGCLLVSLAACPVFVGAEGLAPGVSSKGSGQASPGKPADIGEMREWLNRRNVERKQLGIPGADMPKSHATASHPRIGGGQNPPLEKAPENTAAQERGTPVLHLGRGPDGRIHVRYILKEEGPDQLQVGSAEGYVPASPAEEAAKLDRLTPRGKQIWLSGSSLRPGHVSRWLNRNLDPKVKD